MDQNVLVFLLFILLLSVFLGFDISDGAGNFVKRPSAFGSVFLLALLQPTKKNKLMANNIFFTIIPNC